MCAHKLTHIHTPFYAHEACEYSIWSEYQKEARQQRHNIPCTAVQITTDHYTAIELTCIRHIPVKTLIKHCVHVVRDNSTVHCTALYVLFHDLPLAELARQGRVGRSSMVSMSHRRETAIIKIATCVYTLTPLHTTRWTGSV